MKMNDKLQNNRERLAANAIYRMIQTDRLQKNILEHLSNSTEIGRTQHVVLLYLAQRGDLPTQTDLAEYFDVSPAAITVTLKKLESLGLITRSAQENNARANLISLTKAGEEMANKAIQTCNKVNLAMIDGLTDEELNQFSNLIIRMQNNLRDQYKGLETRREKKG